MQPPHIEWDEVECVRCVCAVYRSQYTSDSAVKRENLLDEKIFDVSPRLNMKARKNYIKYSKRSFLTEKYGSEQLSGR